MLLPKRFTSISLFSSTLFLISYASHLHLPRQLYQPPSFVATAPTSVDISNTTPLPTFVDYDKIFLFGDSITQISFDQSLGFAFGAALEHGYVRKLDVVNRGFSGYNTDRALNVLPSIIPPAIHSKIRLVTIFFGANDAVIEGSKQHVPLEEYRGNLKRIIAHPQLTAHNPTMLLITPPPVCEYKMQEWDPQLQRRANVTKEYADAAREVANEVGVIAVDLWSAFMAHIGWHEGEPYPGPLSQPRSEKLGELLRDGLHFSSTGYMIMYDEVMAAINQYHPELRADALPLLFPNFP